MLHIVSQSNKQKMIVRIFQQKQADVQGNEKMWCSRMVSEISRKTCKLFFICFFLSWGVKKKKKSEKCIYLHFFCSYIAAKILP